jgi:hypothetical protein
MYRADEPGRLLFINTPPPPGTEQINQVGYYSSLLLLLQVESR